MTATLTTTATRNHYADAISDAIADAEKILGQPFVVTRIECVTDDLRIPSTRSFVRAPYTATVESTRTDQ